MQTEVGSKFLNNPLLSLNVIGSWKVGSIPQLLSVKGLGPSIRPSRQIQLSSTSKYTWEETTVGEEIEAEVENNTFTIFYRNLDLYCWTIGPYNNDTKFCVIVIRSNSPTSKNAFKDPGFKSHQNTNIFQ